MTIKPLKGLRVVDCSLGLAGPQASGILADYGAEVIWVEPLEGDPARISDPGAVAVYNRGKKSISLDLEDRVSRNKLRALIKTADVFIESWPAGYAKTHELEWGQVKNLNPGLIYCSITGLGPVQNEIETPAYEPLIHALLGTMACQAGHREGPIFQGLPFASTGAAHLALIGILSALYRRLEDGAGRRVDTSLYDGALAFHSMLWGDSEAALSTKQKSAASNVPTATRRRLITRSFVCSDGEYIGIHTAAVGAFDRLMSVLDLADKIPPLERGNDLGTQLTDEEAEYLDSRIHDIFASRDRAYWVERLLKADVCAVEHQQPGQAFDVPQARHNEMVIELDDPVLGPVEQVGPGIRIDGRMTQPDCSAPRLGANNDELPELSSNSADASIWRPVLPEHGKMDTRPLLEGVCILDAGAFYAGPFSSRLLADLGADVIKVEPVQGDQLRGLERPFFAAQAGKRSLAANLKEEALKPALQALIQWADIVHHNMRPGVAERLGIGLEQVRKINPNSIYLYAPGWGDTGPHNRRQSFAPMLAGYVGASYEVAGQYNEPMPSLGNEDPGNGLVGAVAMLIGLLRRRVTGAVSDCVNPQLNAAMTMMNHIVRSDKEGAIGAQRLDVLQMGTHALESLYETLDGWICLVARTDLEINALSDAFDLEILKDPDFASPQLRAQNRDELSDKLRDVFLARSTDEVLQAVQGGAAQAILVEPRGADCVTRFLENEEDRRIGRVATVNHPELGRVREISKLVRVSGADQPNHQLAPALGEHSLSILTELGYSGSQIVELEKAGILHMPSSERVVSEPA